MVIVNFLANFTLLVIYLSCGILWVNVTLRIKAAAIIVAERFTSTDVNLHTLITGYTCHH